MSAPELLLKLLAAPGPSGYEEAPSAVWRAAAGEFAEVSFDTLGSSVAQIGGTADGPLLAVLGHIDEIGLIVTHIDETGMLYVRNVGGWDPEILRGQRIELLARSGRIPGVIGKKWTGRRRPGEERTATKLEDLHIDIGAKDREQAKERVRIGDVAVIAGEPVELSNGRLASRSLDNRLGAYVALEAARRVAADGAPGGFAAVAAVQEEVGDFAGARTVTFALEPKVALAVDVIGATDVPGGDPKEGGAYGLGSGPVIGRGSTINPGVFELLYETAEAEQIPFTVGVSTGATHTDMDAVHLSRTGVAAGLVSIPTRYLHSPTELVALEDVEAAVRLVVAFAQRLSPDHTFDR